MNYQKIYDDLIIKRKNYPIFKKDQYCEKHHIIPKCLNGTNEKENLVNLTAKEHFIAHLLLCKIHSKNYYLLYAFIKMCNLKKYNKMNKNLYQKVKLEFAQEVSKRTSKSWEERFGYEKAEFLKNKMRQPYESKFGVEKSNKIKEKQRKAFLGDKNPNFGKSKKGANNPMYGKHHTKEAKIKIGLAQTGKIESKETRTKKSNSHKGLKIVRIAPSSMKGKNHSKKSRQQMSQSRYNLFNKGYTSPLLGRIRVNNGSIGKAVLKEELNYYLNNGFTLGTLKNKLKKVAGE